MEDRVDRLRLIHREAGDPEAPFIAVNLAAIPDAVPGVSAPVTVPGIGEWTAHMFLIFALRRNNVLPTGDLGVRSAIRTASFSDVTASSGCPSRKLIPPRIELVPIRTRAMIQRSWPDPTDPSARSSDSGA